MSITNLISYELLGPKEEFAGWVSNISPYDTPFTSLTGKARVYNKVFEWQTDHLDLIDANNAWLDDVTNLPKPRHFATKVHNNYTQIFRKVVEVSDTAEALTAHGRPSELEYQIEKATKEIKRDLESTFLGYQVKDEGSANNTRLMSGFYDLVAKIDEAEPNTGAITHKKLATDTFTEDDIYDLTENLYMAGARANVVMFHPSHAKTFGKFFENGNHTKVSVYFNDDDEVPNALTKFVDPLGQEFILLPNRMMDPYVIYFFHPHDWFQRVLRNPTVSQLDKTGSNESWMLEMEVSLQHRNPWASGILELTYTPVPRTISIHNVNGDLWLGSKSVQLDYTSSPNFPNKVEWVSDDPTVATVNDTGLVTFVSAGDVKIVLTGTYYRNETAVDSINLKIVPTVVDRSVPILTVKQADTYDLRNNFSVSPQEAHSLGYKYEVTSGNTFISCDSAGILTAIAEGSGTVKITSLADSSLFVDVMVNVVTTSHTVTWTGLQDIRINDELTLTFESDTTLPPLNDIFILSAYPVDVKIDPSSVIRVDDTHITAKLVAERVVSQESQAVIVQIRYPDGVYQEYKPFSVKDYVVKLGSFPASTVSTKTASATISEVSGFPIPAGKTTWHTTGTALTVNVQGVVTFAVPGSGTLTGEVEFVNNVGTGSVKRSASHTFTVIEPEFHYNGASPLVGFKGKSVGLDVNSTNGDITKGTLSAPSTDPNVATALKNPTVPGNFTVSFFNEGNTDLSVVWVYATGRSKTITIPVQVYDVVVESTTDLITLAPGDTVDLDTVFSTTPPESAAAGFDYTIRANGAQDRVSLNGNILTAVKDTDFANSEIRATLKGTGKGKTIEVKVEGKYGLKAQTSFSTSNSDNRYHLVQGNQMQITIVAPGAAADNRVIYNVDWSARDQRLGYVKADANSANQSNVILHTEAANSFKPDGQGMGVSDYPFDSDVADGNGIDIRVQFRDSTTNAIDPTIYHIPLNFHMEYR